MEVEDGGGWTEVTGRNAGGRLEKDAASPGRGLAGRRGRGGGRGGGRSSFTSSRRRVNPIAGHLTLEQMQARADGYRWARQAGDGFLPKAVTEEDAGRRERVRKGMGSVEDLATMEVQRRDHAETRRNSMNAGDGVLPGTKDHLEIARRARARAGKATAEDLETLKKQRIARFQNIQRAKLVDTLGQTADPIELQRRRRVREGTATEEDLTAIEKERKQEEERKIANSRNPSVQRTFASIVRPAAELPEGVTTALSYTEPEERKGRRGALLRPELIKKIENARFAGTLLVRRFTDERIDPRFAKNFIRQIWGIQGDQFNVQIRGSGVFIIQFRRSEDYDSVKSAGDTWMNGVYTMVKNWKVGKAIEHARITRLPIWVGLPNFPAHIWSPEVFSAIGSVLGRPVKVDAHTAMGPNANGAKLLVIMEAAGSFPTEVPIFMHGEDGAETEDGCAVTYIKLPPICGKCISFGHEAENCKYTGGFTGEEEIATFAGKTDAEDKDSSQSNVMTPIEVDEPAGNDEAQQDAMIGTTGAEVGFHQVGNHNSDAAGKDEQVGDDVVQAEERIGTTGENLNEVEMTASEKATTGENITEVETTTNGKTTTGADVETEGTIHQFMHNLIDDLVGPGLISPKRRGDPESLSPSQQLANLIGRGSGGSQDRPENKIRSELKKTEEWRNRGDGGRGKIGEEDSTVGTEETAGREVRDRTQREGIIEHATKDDSLGIDSSRRTEKQRMGADSLSRMGECSRADGETYGVGEIARMTRMEVSEEISHGLKIDQSAPRPYDSGTEPCSDRERLKTMNSDRVRCQLMVNELNRLVNNSRANSTKRSSPHAINQHSHATNQINSASQLSQVHTGRFEPDHVAAPGNKLIDLIFNAGAGGTIQAKQPHPNISAPDPIAAPQITSNETRLSRKKKSTDPTQLNRRSKSGKKKGGNVLPAEDRGTAPMITRAAVSNMNGEKPTNVMIPSSRAEMEIGKRIRSPGTPTDGLKRKRNRETEKEIDGIKDRQTEEIGGNELEKQEIDSTPQKPDEEEGSRDAKAKQSTKPSPTRATSKGKKTSKNKLKQQARRENQGDMVVQIEKEISSKGRKDYLIEPDDGGHGLSERKSGRLDFPELNDEEGDSEGEYEHGMIQWQEPSLVIEEDDLLEDVRREESQPDSAAKGGVSGGGELKI